jgi:hypothetical protein
MYSRMVLTLTRDEHAALVQLAASQQRHPDQQLRYLLRLAAEERGLLPQLNEDTNRDPPTQKVSDQAICVVGHNCV